MSEDNIEREMHSDMYKHCPPSLKIISNNIDKIDPENKRFSPIMKNDMNKALKEMLTDKETGKTLSYSEMKSKYG
tara:strand:- start:8 stop:232 length:225 start_codon:yes stop_codon:yes gene_type:complete